MINLHVTFPEPIYFAKHFSAAAFVFNRKALRMGKTSGILKMLTHGRYI